jgi:hypothetical protein
MEITPMENEIKTVITRLATKIDGTVKSEDALRFTQAALNLAAVLATMESIKR